jgi:hypothetical protein
LRLEFILSYQNAANDSETEGPSLRPSRPLREPPEKPPESRRSGNNRENHRSKHRCGKSSSAYVHRLHTSTSHAAPDRQLASIFAFLGTRPDLDASRVVVWGFCMEGYYTLRAALLGCVSPGGGCYYMFDRAWLERADYMEYPFDLASMLAYKFGYTLDEFYTEGAQFSP